ncbi:MAG: ABC transporter ATP-binding protein [Candidatus Caldarchaeum sp.]|nr:ABC transporter ATP-binding protein [Candidatus Caldarchaeum sp.]MDW8360174.1 ABC transporter ATP-binding protein [Candidatus Caldarchaeum sp.]
MNYILTSTNVTKKFGGVAALDDVSLSIRRGSMALLIGPNGSGKSTLVNVITGVYKAERGRVFFDGVDITNLTPHTIYDLGLARTWQIPQPFMTLTVLENLLVAEKGNPGEGVFSSLLRRRWEKFEEESVERAYKILKILKLDHLWDRQAYGLSGGQMKLLETGRALMSGAKMIMMDEPAAGINPVLAHEVFTHLREVNRKLGITFLLIEHRLDIAVPYVDHVYAMHQGKIIAEGHPTEVLNNVLVIESYLGG